MRKKKKDFIGFIILVEDGNEKDRMNIMINCTSLKKEKKKFIKQI